MENFVENIIESQSREIEQMTAWLNKWYINRENYYEYQAMMDDYKVLKGDQLDQIFLEDMIFH